MESEVVITGSKYIELEQNHYNEAGDDVTLKYRHGSTEANCLADFWKIYSEPFNSLGYVQVRIDYPGLGLLEVSTNGRYLQDQSETPFLLISDSPQGMLVAISTTDMDTYFSARAAQGFNATQVHVIAGPAFGGGANYETYDDIHPFTVNGDISTPNNTYFNRLDTLVSIAESYGIVVFLNATEHVDAGDLWETNGNTKCYNWGAYLGNRYKDCTNIVWMIGNDFQDWSTDAGKVAADINVINGIQSADANHTLYTAWLDYYHSASRDSSDFNAECTLDFGYTYYIAYDKIADEYALDPAKPVFLGETYYEDYSVLGLIGTPFIIRKENYGAMLAGACGITYGNDNWDFHTGWDDDITMTGATQIIHLKNLFAAYDWWLLEPDTAHAVLTSGYATWATGEVQPDDNDFAYCAWIDDGSLAIIYMSTNRTMSVDMSKFSGTVTCRWYDPTSGQYETDAASPHANSGSHDFSHAGANDASETDWVLVLSV